MDNEENKSSNKRVTPGRSAKTNNKRKQPDESPTQGRTVRPKLADPDGKMALTLEMLQKELAANNKVQNDHLDTRLTTLTNNIAANTNLIVQERKERKDELKLLNDRIAQLTQDRGRDGNDLRQAAPSGRSSAYSAREEDEYNKNERERNTLILFPIEGETADAQMLSLQKFLSTDLRIGKGEIKRNQIVLIRRCPHVQKCKNKERIARFVRFDGL